MNKWDEEIAKSKMLIASCRALKEAIDQIIEERLEVIRKIESRRDDVKLFLN